MLICGQSTEYHHGEQKCQLQQTSMTLNYDSDRLFDIPSLYLYFKTLILLDNYR